MSNSNTNSTQLQEFKRNNIHIKCNQHQTLNEIYLIQQKKFICEYDIFDLNSDNNLHLSEILEQNREKILKLQNPKRKNDSKILEVLPPLNEEYDLMQLELEELSSLVNKFDLDFLKRLTNVIYSNEAFEEIQEMINQIKFNEQGKPDMRRICSTPYPID